MKIRFVSLLLTLVLASFSEAEVLHKWLEPNPDHSYTYGNTDEDLFYTYTTKDASRSESEGSWQVTGSATASANAQAPLPRGQDLKTEFDAHALLRATGDRHAIEPHTGDGLAKAEDDSAVITKPSADNTTTARTKRKAHIVIYQQRVGQETIQRSFDAYTDGSKSETSVSPTDLDADPWASSWLEVRRRVALNNEVPDSPFESKTPRCESSGNGHTCEGYVSPEEAEEIGHCERGEACLTPRTSVKNRPRAHIIDCPEQTYKQGIWSWLMLKIKEDCKGEKWSCHSESDNCTLRHLHLKNASEATANETVVNGYVVPAGYSVGACGEHLYNDSSDHTLQASCSTNTNCISTNFYLCQHTTHEVSGDDNAPGAPAAPNPYPNANLCICPDGQTYHTSLNCTECGADYFSCNLPPHITLPCPLLTDTTGIHPLFLYCSYDNFGDYYACTPHEHVYNNPVPPPVTPPPPPIQQPPPPVNVPEAPPVTPPPQQPPPENVPEAPPIQQPPVSGSCSIHTIPASQAAAHTSVNFECGLHSYFACQPPSSTQTDFHTYATLPCGTHSGRLCTVPAAHTELRQCPRRNGNSCTIGTFYACDPHTHQYPTPTPTVRCGNSWTGPGACIYDRVISGTDPNEHRSSACDAGHTYWTCNSTVNVSNWENNHRTRTCPRRNGNSCTIGTFYACDPHTHQYPTPTPTVRCGNSWTGPGACIYDRVVSSSSTEHQSSPCSAGHTYWTCNSTVNVSNWENKHRVRTCRRSGCGNTWQACVDGWNAPQCNTNANNNCWAQ